MKAGDQGTILHRHHHRTAEFGARTHALGWRSEPSQHGRFEAIAAAAEFSGITVLDMGCGQGDLKEYLDERFEGVRDLGVDQMPEFIEAARVYGGDEAGEWVRSGTLSRISGVGVRADKSHASSRCSASPQPSDKPKGLNNKQQP